jgi:hypothetical protein
MRQILESSTDQSNYINTRKRTTSKENLSLEPKKVRKYLYVAHLLSLTPGYFLTPENGALSDP